MSKVLYPSSNNLSAHPDAASIKISRNCNCLVCENCSGLRPGPDIELVRDDDSSERETALINDLVGYGSDDEDGASGSGNGERPYISACRCGHGVKEHGADESVLGEEEFARRSALAVRIDEHLEQVGRLLDFDYRDEDVDALRQLIKPSLTSVAASPLTEAGASPVMSQNKLPLSSPSSQASGSQRAQPPPSKRRRISESSLSDAEDDDNDASEEDQPLAARISNLSPSMARVLVENGRTPASSAVGAKGNGNGAGRRGGKTSGMKFKAHTAPTSIAPPTGEVQAEMNGEIQPINGHETAVKVEDRLDEGQLDRLATGVTVDTADSATTTAPPVKPEKTSAIELRRGVIQILPVENDKQPRSLVILTNLKTLFQKQLPVMPREYIARLVFDRNQKCLAICKRGYKVVGGICYRPFEHRGFAEIVFFATASVDQEKGYGGLLMDHFKAHIKRTYPNMMHFLTYADNYAVGYFRKQGFSKEITLDRSIWAGYIKDYEGGTIMQCTMLPKVDYLSTKELVAKQREAILTKIRQMSKSHVVYEGLKFEVRREGGVEGGGEGGQTEEKVVPIDPKDIPGLRESGWSPSMIVRETRPSAKDLEKSTMKRLLTELQAHGSSWAFLAPVNVVDAPDYYDVIKNPMDFGTMEIKVETNQYQNLEAFLADAQLVFDNCRKYNAEGSIFWKNANKVEKLLKDLVSRLRN